MISAQIACNSYSSQNIVGDIYISNSVINFVGGRESPAIGAVYVGRTGDITVENCRLNINAPTWIGFKVGNITIKKTDVPVSKLQSAYGTVNVSQAAGFTPFTFKNVHSGMIEPENTNETPQKIVEPIIERTVTYVTRTVELPGIFEFNPLKIHHGTKSNQATNFYIDDMHTKSLGTGDLVSGTNFKNEEDEERYWALSYDKRKQNDWLKTLEDAQNKNLNDVSVTTKKDANVAIRVIDGAIDYSLDQATRIGAYLQRLEYTSSNIVTMNENIQSAESTIRDADMAKEMTEYTKANVLTQAAQSMLAQANQNSSGVLSLLQ